MCYYGPITHKFCQVVIHFNQRLVLPTMILHLQFVCVLAVAPILAQAEQQQAPPSAQGSTRSGKVREKWRSTSDQYLTIVLYRSPIETPSGRAHTFIRALG